MWCVSRKQKSMRTNRWYPLTHFASYLHMETTHANKKKLKKWKTTSCSCTNLTKDAWKMKWTATARKRDRAGRKCTQRNRKEWKPFDCVNYIFIRWCYLFYFFCLLPCFWRTDFSFIHFYVCQFTSARTSLWSITQTRFTLLVHTIRVAIG